MNNLMLTNSARFAGATAVRSAVATRAETASAPTILVAAVLTPTVQFQSGWRWCHKCQGLFWGNSDQGTCAARGPHDSSESGIYSMAFGVSGPGMQPGWRWCHKCQGLFFSGNPDQGPCPTGARHDSSGSGAYLMTFGDGAQGMQRSWRWCQKCQGLFFAGHRNQGTCPGGGLHDASRSGSYSTQLDPNSVPKPVSLPLVSSQTGNLFVDRNDPNLHWYLPDFTLADDMDHPQFAFAASQSGQDAQGNPLNRATVTLRLHKSPPAEVVTLSANPDPKLQEIPLAEMSAILSSFYNDDQGQQQERTAKGKIEDVGNGDLRLIFDSILGPFVIGLYQDLTVFGKAVINLSASYQAWAQNSATLIGLQLTAGLTALTDFKLVPSASASPTFTRTDQARQFRSLALVNSSTVATAEPDDDTLTQIRQTWTKPLPLSLKYQQGAYQAKYTVSTATQPDQMIRDVKDLKDFSRSQTEFTELKVLGDVSQRYPTLSRLYIGTVSRTIVVIPKRYSILRSVAGCAASCLIEADSSSANGSACKFEFSFTIAPEVSRIEYAMLCQEILNREDLKLYTPKLPDFLHDTPASTLATQFKSGVAFTTGPDPKTFVVNVFIDSADPQEPTVTDANLFIMRLCSSTGADLVGSLSLKLDDGYPDLVQSTIDLNFAHTAGTDEIDVEFDEATALIKLTNKSSLDMQISGYALIMGPAITEVRGPLLLPAGGSLTAPLPADHTGLTVAVDAQLVIPHPMPRSAVTQFLLMRTLDVELTQYLIEVEGGSVDFDKVDSVEVKIDFAEKVSAPQSLTLSKNVHSESMHITIPLANALSSLKGTATVTVHFVQPGPVELVYQVAHDFVSDDLMLALSQSDIDSNLAKV